MPAPDRSHALDHVVVVLFENRSYAVATDMDSPGPDSGEEYFHTNTQLFGISDDHNRFKIGDALTAPWNAPQAGSMPTMDGFVTDYISALTGETGRQPSYDECPFRASRSPLGRT
jgi:phospholipase C